MYEDDDNATKYTSGTQTSDCSTYDESGTAGCSSADGGSDFENEDCGD